MSRDHHGDWPAYVPVAERRRQAEREAAKLRKKGQALAPVRIEGRAIAGTPWGKAWCSNLESYRDYESRLPRGRTYVRNGLVIDLQVRQCEIKALVSGSAIYRVAIGITAIPAAQWRALCADCAGRIDSLVELLQGRLSKGVMERMCRQGAGLFPKPSEVRFTCTCEDHASMCKHVAAVLYGVGARLDEKPELLFRLRGVDAGDLLADLDGAVPASRSAGTRTLEAEDVSALFGLDLAGSEDANGGLAGPPSRRAAPAAQSRPEQARRGRPSPPGEAVPAREAISASSRKAGAAKPVSPDAKSLRPGPAPAVLTRVRPPASAPESGAPTTMPSAPKERTAAQLGAAKKLDKKAAEKVVADVIALIGQHLVMGVDVTRAEQGTPKAGARDARVLLEPTAGSGLPTPGRRKPAVEPAKRRKAAV